MDNPLNLDGLSQNSVENDIVSLRYTAIAAFDFVTFPPGAWKFGNKTSALGYLGNEV